MRPILFMIRKEFIQVFRNKQMLPMIFVLPIVQLLLLVYAATMEIKNVDIDVIDNDKSDLSRQLIEKFAASKYFTILRSVDSDKLAYRDLAENNADMALKIPSDFEKNIINGGESKVQFIIDAVDGSAAGLINAYSTAIVLSYNRSVKTDLRYFSHSGTAPQIDVRERYLYNPELDYKQYMAPGILVILVTFITMFLTAMNVVSEKEIGTIEQLNVTPIRKHQFLIGKLLPFWFIGLFELGFGMVIAKIAFHIPMVGSILLLFGLAALYFLVTLGAALLISTITETQQQAMFISWFFIVIFILMSGLFTPIDSMPRWAQIIALFNPVAHFVEIMRRVLLKGAGFSEITDQFLILCGYAAAVMSLAIWRYRKTTS